LTNVGVTNAPVSRPATPAEASFISQDSEVRWPLKRHTLAKHQILRWYLDAWLAILGSGSWAKDDVVLIDGFAGPGRYRDGEKGSPLLMLDAYLEHSADITARGHFYFIEENPARAQYLQGQIDGYVLPNAVEAEVIQGSFDVEFSPLIERLRRRFSELPPTFAFIDPFGAGGISVALSTPLLSIPRCELLVYVPVAHLARFVDHPDLTATLNTLYGSEAWREATKTDVLEERKRILHDLFLAEVEKKADWTRSFEITPQAGHNSYYLFFGTNSERGLQRMKDAMWRVDPQGGTRFRDSTIVDHPVLFEEKPDLSRLLTLLREHFGARWFTIKEAEKFTLRSTPFRDNGHLKTPTLKPADKRGEIEVERPAGKPAGSFTPGTRMRFTS
jgi:three-Cys-motif partner protein